jgi:hypothetical protein
MNFDRLLAASAALVALAASPAQAQLFRAYLALDGSDANPCTLLQPCRLLPAALTAVQSGGEIWMLDSANYNAGPVTVSKSVTILAIPGSLGSVVALGGDALIVGTTGTVTLRNLNILPFPGNADRTGVNKNGAGTLTIQDCNIYGFSEGGTGAIVQGGANVTVTRSVFRDNESRPYGRQRPHRRHLRFAVRRPLEHRDPCLRGLPLVPRPTLDHAHGRTQQHGWRLLPGPGDQRLQLSRRIRVAHRRVRRRG